MNYPQIIIKDGWLLRENASKHLHELWAKPGGRLADDEEMTRIVDAYTDAWNPYEKKIVHGMCELLDLEFAHNIIDVYIAPWFNGFSDPLVIGVVHKPDLFIDILTHELLHRLLTANTNVINSKQNLKAKWQELFGEHHSFKTLVHIPVHTVHKSIYLDVLGETDRFNRDVERNKNNDDYKKAWDYVNEVGYDEILGKLRLSYN